MGERCETGGGDVCGLRSSRLNTRRLLSAVLVSMQRMLQKNLRTWGIRLWPLPMPVPHWWIVIITNHCSMADVIDDRAWVVVPYDKDASSDTVLCILGDN